ncbi:hypothetical protein [Synechocystis sp. PCC 7509]|uniref:hypothetical protein n=1 Tax=Synechocystis sp. PCC 7509 TaxID=927677 RepID=UPI0002EBA008|nr:hypothetical protein [Synechocystis sp. PCC 7509]
MNTQRSRFDLNNFKLLTKAIAPITLILLAAVSLYAPRAIAQNRSGVSYRTPLNNPTIYNNPINSSVIYGSPIPAPSITYPHNYYPYPNNSYTYPNSVVTYPNNSYTYPNSVVTYPNNSYTYPNYHPGSVIRVREGRSRWDNRILVNPIIRDSTLINPTIIKIQPQRRYR